MNVAYHLDTSDVLRKEQRRKVKGTTLKPQKKANVNSTKNFKK